MRAWKLALATGAIFALSCSDPFLDGANDEQGNETAGVEQGPYHRPGSNCVTCHREGGEASDSPFTMAGTVFAQPLKQVGVDSAEIRLTDADGTKYLAKTNCVGNFFVRPSDWVPKFPVLVEVAKGGVRRSMRSAIGREPSCSVCHTPEIPPKDPLGTVGHIYLFSGDEPNFPEGLPDCPADPVKFGGGAPPTP
jgi:mono/diheme cytochrome c family protein